MLEQCSGNSWKEMYKDNDVAVNKHTRTWLNVIFAMLRCRYFVFLVLLCNETILLLTVESWWAGLSTHMAKLNPFIYRLRKANW